jgi:galactokinase/mevalonate kinase-like predicted kinase
MAVEDWRDGGHLKRQLNQQDLPSQSGPGRTSAVFVGLRRAMSRPESSRSLRAAC